LNIFRRFKDHFSKIPAIVIVTDGLPLTFNREGEPYFSFYWKFDPTRFKSFDEDLLTLVEKVNKAILK